MSTELHRDLAMKAIYATKTWKDCWPTWVLEIRSRTASFTDAKRVYELGSDLREIFFLTNTKGRSQNGVSGAGIAW